MLEINEIMSMFSGRSVLGIAFGSLTVSWRITGIGFGGARGTTSSISISLVYKSKVFLDNPHSFHHEHF